MVLFTPDIVIANPIPKEVKIYYSKDSAIIRILFLTVFLIIGAFWLFNEQWVIGAVLTLIALILIIINLKGLLDKRPQIIINTSGIQTIKTPFYNWSEIKNERVAGEYEGRGARPILEYDYPGGNESIKVEPLNITPQDLNVLISFYRKPWGFHV
ncbi:MAG: hypothetical protein EOO85_32385 [Pedobacter sp.]|nr:MAG: hypothetical protein EOO85_32385 [Pedobacter sp.]